MEHTKPSKSKKRRIPATEFNIPVNGRSYEVSAAPFVDATGDMFYRVSYNNGPVHLFGWDPGLSRFAEADTQADVIPPVIEMAIAGKLNAYTTEIQKAA